MEQRSSDGGIRGGEWYPKPRVTFSNSMTSPKNKMLPRVRGLPIARCQLMHKLRHPADINKPLQEAAKEKVAKYQSDYANDQRITFMPAAFTTSGSIDTEFLRGKRGMSKACSPHERGSCE